MPTSAPSHLTYLGYTLGANKPTLYFVEGRYTQEHSKATNVGWHPIHSFHRGANISKTEHDRYSSIRNDPSKTKEKKDFKKDFLKGDFDSNAKDAKYFECDSSDNKNWSAHPSRARLMEIGDQDFDQTYDAKYAKNIVANGYDAS